MEVAAEPSRHMERHVFFNLWVFGDASFIGVRGCVLKVSHLKLLGLERLQTANGTQKKKVLESIILNTSKIMLGLSKNEIRYILSSTILDKRKNTSWQI